MSVTDRAHPRPALHHGWAGPRSGRVTVVLHGGGPGCHATADFAAVMARGERRWLWVDLPGYGGSAPAPEPGDRPVSDAARAVRALLTELGLADVDVLAQSLGGSVALRLSAESPEAVRRMVLIGSTPTPAPGGRTDVTRDAGLGARVRAQYYDDGPSETAMRALLAHCEWHDATRIPAATVTARHRAAVATGGRPLTAPAPAEDLADVLGDVAAPALVLWGRCDPFAGPDYAAALADALPRGDLCVLGRSAHHPQAERPGTVAALAAAFLTDRS